MHMKRVATVMMNALPSCIHVLIVCLYLYHDMIARYNMSFQQRSGDQCFSQSPYYL